MPSASQARRGQAAQSQLAGRYEPPPSAGAVARDPQVVEELSMLEAAVDDLLNVASNLAARLAPITSPGSDDPAEDQSDPYRVPVADKIRAERRRIQVQVSALVRLTANLEI